jgi:hypothetical protein
VNPLLVRIGRRLRAVPSRTLGAALAGLSLASVAAISFASAHVHHGADGSSVSWYPRDCCHDGDCHPVSHLQTLPNGFLMTTEDGTTLFVTSQKLRRQSHDSRWHICFGSHEYVDVLCVFEPPGS